MISGPTPPHPRIVLKGLLEGMSAAGPGCAGGDVLESGLEILEEGLRVGEDLRIDFLGRDAVGVPVLILAVDAEDETWAPLRILDADLWFRDNAFLLARGLGRVGAEEPRVRWDDGRRIFVVTLDVSPRFYQRLEALAGLDLGVWRLRSLFLRGETLWFLQEVAPWRSPPAALPSAPDGIEDPLLGELAERLLLRLANVAPDLEVRGDRFARDVLLAGQPVLRLEVREQALFARVGDRRIEIRVASDVDRVLDAMLRALLAAEAPPSRAAASGPSRRGEPVKLTDEEMAAFLQT